MSLEMDAKTCFIEGRISDGCNALLNEGEEHTTNISDMQLCVGLTSRGHLRISCIEYFNPRGNVHPFEIPFHMQQLLLHTRKDLIHVIFIGTKPANVDSLSNYFCQLGSFRSLNVPDNFSLNDVILAGVPSSLTRINLSFNKGVDGDSLALLGQQCPSLVYIDLTCTRINDSMTEALVEHFPLLKRLRLNSSRVDDETVQILARDDSPIRHLELASTHLTKETIVMLLEACPQLEHLCLKNCSELSSSIIEELRDIYRHATIQY